MDIVITLAVLAAMAYWLIWEDRIKPWLFPQRPESVKGYRARRPGGLRSRVRTLANAANVAAPDSSAENPPANVRANVHATGAISGPLESPLVAGGVMSITSKELTQLARAIDARARGATLEAAILAGWGIKKGGGPAYRRARQLFDLAAAGDE